MERLANYASRPRAYSKSYRYQAVMRLQTAIVRPRLSQWYRIFEYPSGLNAGNIVVQQIAEPVMDSHSAISLVISTSAETGPTDRQIVSKQPKR